MSERAGTTGLSQYGHPEIEFETEGVIAPDVAMLKDYLTLAVANGTQFKAGQTIQMGWSVMKLVPAGEKLELHEPDIQKMVEGGPSAGMQFRPGVSDTLRAVRLMRDAADSVGLVEKLDFPRFDRQAAICGKFFDSKSVAMMYRLEPGAPSESGWFIGCDDVDHDHGAPDAGLRTMPLFVIVAAQPAVMPFLGLPEEAAVLMPGTRGAKVLLGKMELPFRAGSYLAMRAQRS